MFTLEKSDCIYVAGHKGLVGSAIYTKLNNLGFNNLLTRTSKELDLRDKNKTQKLIAENRPRLLIIAAARVGGIGANLSDPLGFISDNLEIQTNLMLAAANTEVEKIVFLGSSCVYPRLANQPINESSLLSGYLEETNQPYAVAKISGIELLNAINKEYGTRHFTIMPCNLFGQNDNYSEGKSHVLPAMIRKFHDAKVKNMKTLSLWGTGSPMREFMHSDDFADALIHSVFKYQSGGLLNIGSGKEISILNLAQTIANVIGFEGEITWDSSKPDGTPRKLLDISKLNSIGWEDKSRFVERITETYNWYLKNQVFEKSSENK